MKAAKWLVRGLILALVIIFCVNGVGLAGSTTKNLSTNYTVVNFGSSTASVTVDYIKENGDPWPADPDKSAFTVDPNYGNKTIAQYFDATMSPGKGSAILSSNQPLGAVVTIQARGQVATQGAYNGYGSGSNIFYVPLVVRNRNTANGFSNTQIMIQNIDAGNAAITAHVDFIASPGSGYSNWTKTGIPIASGATYYYDVADELPANLPNGWIGSAVVTGDSGKEIAVVSNVFSGANGLQTYNAFPQEAASTGWAFPQFASRLPNGFNTVVNIQNVSGAPIAANGIHMHCIPGVGFVGNLDLYNPADVPANATTGFNPYTDHTIPGNWNGSCSISATGNVVVTVTLRRPGVTEEISGYEAFHSANTDTRIVFPNMAKRLANGFATNGIIMNLDAVNPALVRLVYTRAPGIVVGDPTYTLDVTIPAGGQLQQNLRLTSDPVGLSMPSGWSGTLLVEPQPAQPARPLIGYVALTNYLNPPGDTQMAHQGFTLP